MFAAAAEGEMKAKLRNEASEAIDDAGIGLLAGQDRQPLSAKPLRAVARRLQATRTRTVFFLYARRLAPPPLHSTKAQRSGEHRARRFCCSSHACRLLAPALCHAACL